MRTPALASALAVLLLSACTTPAYVSPVEVTRFSGTAPAQLGRGAVTVMAAPGDTGADSLEFSLYRNAVAEELRRIGYTVASGGTDQVAEIALERGVNAPVVPGGRGPVSVGVGGGTGGFGSGLGVGLGINLGGGSSRDTQELYRQMRVTIRSGTTPLWEGRANFTASTNSDYAGEQAAAGRLAQALFAGFPGESGETIEVR